MLGLSHPGAVELAARLVEIAPPGLSRVFYSDSGSTAVEVALKMAFQYWQHRGGQHVRRTLASSASRTATTATRSARSPSGAWTSSTRPSGRCCSSRTGAAPGDIEAMARLLRAHEEELVAVIVEPLVQGAAGMVLHPPGYLRAVRELCDRHGVLLICDEVATGFGRTGTMFACEQEGVAPDLMCLAKGLTGGYMPLAATLATERIYEAFLGAHDGVQDLLPRPHLHRQPARLRRGARLLSTSFELERTLVRLQPKIRLLTELLGEVEAMPEVAEVRQRGFMVGIDLGEHDPELRLGPPRGARGAPARRDRAPARRRRRADAAALDHEGGAAPARRRSSPTRSDAAYPVASLDPAAAGRIGAALLEAA